MFLFVVILLFGSVSARTHAYMRTQPTKVVKKMEKYTLKVIERGKIVILCR